MNYKIKENGVISCCAWCFPAKTVLDACPELDKAVQISHGICDMHKAQVFGALKNPASDKTGRVELGGVLG